MLFVMMDLKLSTRLCPAQPEEIKRAKHPLQRMRVREIRRNGCRNRPSDFGASITAGESLSVRLDPAASVDVHSDR